MGCMMNTLKNAAIDIHKEEHKQGGHDEEQKQGQQQGEHCHRY